jgi:hypothetical protein
MCNPANNPNPAEQEKQTPQTVSSDIQLANLNLQIANTKANAEYNLSVAGQLQRQFEAMQRVAKPYAESTIVPKSYQGNLGNCIIAIDLAFRLNLPPMAVMQNLYIVNGNPSWSSKFLVATINTCGRFTNIRYRKRNLGPLLGKVKYNDTAYDPQKKQKTIVVREYDATGIDNWECVAYATEKATGEVLESDPVTIEMAIKEGWYTKSGSKWVTMPLLMLTYRAAAFWQRAYAPEVSMGFRTVEEEEDVIETGYEDLSATSSAPSSPASSIEKAKDRIRAARSKTGDETPETATTETPNSKTQQS